jgi:hypothetical protein
MSWVRKLNITSVSVAHRPTLLRFHDVSAAAVLFCLRGAPLRGAPSAVHHATCRRGVLQIKLALDGSGGYSLGPIGDAPSLSEVSVQCAVL